MMKIKKGREVLTIPRSTYPSFKNAGWTEVTKKPVEQGNPVSTPSAPSNGGNEKPKPPIGGKGKNK